MLNESQNLNNSIENDNQTAPSEFSRETMEFSPQRDRQEQIVPEDTYHQQSEAEIADVIAQALASSLITESPEILAGDLMDLEYEDSGAFLAEAETPEPVKADEDEIQLEAMFSSRPVSIPKADGKQEEPSQEQAEETIADGEPAQVAESEAPEAPVSEETKAEPKKQSKKKSPPPKKKKAPPQKETVPKSTDSVFVWLTKKTERSRRRQQKALPSAKVPLRKQEAVLRQHNKINQILNPIRIVILVLMIFAIAGRKYHWMLLGFLGGLQGTYIAMSLTLVVMLTAWKSLLQAFRKALYSKFSYELYLLIVTVICFAEAVINQNGDSMAPFMGMAWCMVGIAQLHTDQGHQKQLRSIFASRGKTGIRVVKKLWNQTDCIGKGSSGTVGYVRHQSYDDPWHAFGGEVYLLLAAVAAVLSVLLNMNYGLDFLTNFVRFLCLGCPVMAVLGCAKPYDMLTRAVQGKAAVAGWFGMKELSGKKYVMLYDEDFFPAEAIRHKGFKIYGKYTPALLSSFGASLVHEAGIRGLDRVFLRLMKETGGQLLNVGYLSCIEGGIRGRIAGAEASLGTYQFMLLMGMTMPKKAPKNGIFLAIDGELACVFAISYKLQKGSVNSAKSIVKDYRLSPLIVTRNMSINPAFLERHFEIPMGRSVCPKLERRRWLSEAESLKNGATAGYVLRDGIRQYGRMVVGARRVYRFAMGYSIVSILLSAAVMAQTYLALVEGTEIISCPRLLTIHLIMLVVAELGARICARI